MAVTYASRASPYSLWKPLTVARQAIFHHRRYQPSKPRKDRAVALHMCDICRGFVLISNGDEVCCWCAGGWAEKPDKQADTQPRLPWKGNKKKPYIDV